MIPEPTFLPSPAAAQPASFMQLHVQAEVLEQKILRCIEVDPQGAAKAWIGRAHLQKFGWLLGTVADANEAAGISLFYKNTKGESFLFHKDTTVLKVVWDYPLKFELGDVLLEAKYIAAQLIADEYFGGLGELTPYTPEAFLNIPMGEHQEREYHNRAMPDPFEMEDRPNTTVEVSMPGGAVETVNLNPGEKVEEKPEGGFVDA